MGSIRMGPVMGIVTVRRLRMGGSLWEVDEEAACGECRMEPQMGSVGVVAGMVVVNGVM